MGGFGFCKELYKWHYNVTPCTVWDLGLYLYNVMYIYIYPSAGLFENRIEHFMLIGQNLGVFLNIWSLFTS